MKQGILLALVLSLLGSPALACEYYAWVNYGPAGKQGTVGETENVYHSSGVMSLKHGFKAVYSDMGETRRADGFRIENLGPFEHEAVAGKELSDLVAELEGRGYVEKSLRHQLPEVILRNKVPCR